MENLLSQLQANDKVCFEIEDKDKIDFLSFAKELGCTWIGGKPIQPETDACSNHMSVRRDMTIANVMSAVWLAPQFESVPKYDYHAYKEGRLEPPKWKFMGAAPSTEPPHYFIYLPKDK